MPSRFEDCLEEVFGAEQVARFSEEHKEWLRKLWETAFANGMERQRELELGAMIEKHLAKVEIDHGIAGVTFEFYESAPTDIRLAVEDLCKLASTPGHLRR